MKIEHLHKILGREEIDYQSIVSVLSDYACPRDKITYWLQRGELIRVKKGLYVFSKDVAQSHPSIEVLANLIYGPSAISLGYALAFYGMIPEKSTTVTSITSKRNKAFTTPVGDFTYRYMAPHKFSVGVDLVTIGKQKAIRMASPEKALCDHIHLTDKQVKLGDLQAMGAYLLQDMRIHEASIAKLHVNRLADIHAAYRDARILLLIDWVKQLKKTVE